MFLQLVCQTFSKQIKIFLQQSQNLFTDYFNKQKKQQGLLVWLVLKTLNILFVFYRSIWYNQNFEHTYLCFLFNFNLNYGVSVAKKCAKITIFFCVFCVIFGDVKRLWKVCLVLDFFWWEILDKMPKIGLFIWLLYTLFSRMLLR